MNITGKKICAYYLITYLAIIVVRRRGGVCVPHEGGGRPMGGRKEGPLGSDHLRKYHLLSSAQYILSTRKPLRNTEAS